MQQKQNNFFAVTLQNLPCNGGISHCFALDFDVIGGHWCEGRDTPSAGWASGRQNYTLLWVLLITVTKVRDRKPVFSSSSLIFPPFSRQRPLRHGHLQWWGKSSCVSKLSPSKSLGIAALPGLSLWWKALVPSQIAAQDSHLHSQSFQGFWTMH